MKKYLAIIVLCFFCICISCDFSVVRADELSDNINEQLENIDFTDFEEYFNSLTDLPDNKSFFSYIKGMLKGEFNFEFENFLAYVFNSFFTSIKDYLPIFLIIIAISLLCGILQKIKSSFLDESVSEVILFVCLMSIILLLIGQVFSVYKTTENIIKNIAKLSEIMSPIILTLMVASGGSVSASIYKPTVAFLSNGIISIFLYLIMPLVALTFIFNTISNFSSSIKLEKYSAVVSSIIKWIIGFIITIFTVFLSIQGITSATFDGISIKATKYAISNSVPIVGGLVRDGFDLLIAGSILIKNVVGITGVFALFYTIISPILSIFIFSLMLKLVCAIIQPITDSKITNFCETTAKSLSYLTVVLISVGFMLFITILLIIISANAFI